MRSVRQLQGSPRMEGSIQRRKAQSRRHCLGRYIRPQADQGRPAPAMEPVALQNVYSALRVVEDDRDIERHSSMPLRAAMIAFRNESFAGHVAGGRVE